MLPESFSTGSVGAPRPHHPGPTTPLCWESCGPFKAVAAFWVLPEGALKYRDNLTGISFSSQNSALSSSSVLWAGSVGVFHFSHACSQIGKLIGASCWTVKRMFWFSACSAAFPNTSGAAFRLLSPGCAPQQPDTSHPGCSSFSELICSGSSVLGLSRGWRDG